MDHEKFITSLSTAMGQMWWLLDKTGQAEQILFFAVLGYMVDTKLIIHHVREDSESLRAVIKPFAESKEALNEVMFRKWISELLTRYETRKIPR